MIARVLLIIMFVMIALFCWLSLANPVDVEFLFFGRTIPTDLSTLMISSFVVGALLVFLGMLARDAGQAIAGFRRSRQEKRERFIKEELERGLEDFLRGDLAKAKIHFGEVLKRDPSRVDLYLKLSEINLKEGKGQEALHWLERARLIDMKNAEIFLREAELYKEMKQVDQAIATLNRALEVDDTNLKVLRSLRQIYFENGRWEEAIHVQRAILKLTKGKEEEETLFFLGLKYECARALLDHGMPGDLERALKVAKEIIREGKDFLPGFVLLGDIYLRMGNWVSAGRVWGKSFIRFKSVIFVLRLEELYLSREDPSTLLRIYQRAMKTDPQDWVISFFYAKLCVRLEMLDEAVEALDEISLKRKDFPALHRLLAETYLHKKDFSRAAKEFEKTFEMSGRSYLPFYCSSCERESQEWVVYCPQCHHWNSYRIKEGERVVALFPPSVSTQAPMAL
jgi:tetratricopeptide (TPR) repeat protein